MTSDTIPTDGTLSSSDMYGAMDSNLASNGSWNPDIRRIEAAIREILLAIGEDPERDGLADTPKRVARMYREVFSGLESEPDPHLEKTFDHPHDEMIVVRDISYYSMCEHHLLPFFGHATVGYIPNDRIVGLSKIARVVEHLSHRPQVQERLTCQIADRIEQVLDPVGVAVILEAEHTCMTMRGIKKPGSSMVTSVTRGVFRENPATRSEFFNAARTQRT